MCRAGPHRRFDLSNSQTSEDGHRLFYTKRLLQPSASLAHKLFKVTRADYECGLVAPSGIHGGNLLTSPRLVEKQHMNRRVSEAANEES
jgi:hypothetical protein